MKRRTALMMAGMGALTLAAPWLKGAMARATNTRGGPVLTAFDLMSDLTPSAPPAHLPEHLASVPGLRMGDIQGIPAWIIDTDHATAAISILGGQVLSWIPRGGHDVFWLSPLTRPLPTPIRGGVPVCWPYFARQGQHQELPSHGFVRTLPWELQAAQHEDDGTLALTLAPLVLEHLPLRVSMQLRIGRRFSQTLASDNISAQPVAFTQALHNYFRVSHALQVDVTGLDGRTYLDKLDNGREYLHHGHWNLRDPRDPGRSDRIYTQTAGQYVIRDAGLSRAIHMTTQGSQSAVLWNPGETVAQQLADIGPGWRDYIALEAANAGPDVVELSAGEQHRLQQTLEITPI